MRLIKMRLIKVIFILLVSLTIATTLSANNTVIESDSAELPVLNPSSNDPIDLIFSEPTPVRDIYFGLSRAWGVNFVFDPRLKDRELVITLENITPREGLDSIMRAAGHFRTVVDRQTVMIADDTPQNRRTYEHQVIQSFYLENTRVAEMMTLMRSLIGAKHIAAMERTNGLVVRDTAERVRVAEQLVRRNDRPAAEVVVDVDLLAVDRKALLELDLRPAKGVAGGGPPPRLASGEIDRLRDQESTRTLARPRLDIVAGSTAELQLTDKLPISVQATAASGTRTSQVSYQDVGLEMKIRPWVHNAQDVSLRIQIAADTLTDWTHAGGLQQPTFGGVSLESDIRLQDGETYLVTGLMIAPESVGTTKRPPAAGRFLQAVESGREIVLALTPHVVRGPNVLDSDREPLWVGTEAHITTAGNTRRAASPVPDPFESETGDDD